MLGTFLGLETAVRGLATQQAAIETSAHNIANASTPGFSRQRVDMAPSVALEVPGLMSTNAGQIGTGVQVEAITRQRDAFLDQQYRDQNQYLGSWTVQQATLDNVTSILNEPSDTGLSTVTQNFWNAWSTLGQNPSDLSARTQVLQAGQTLAQTLNQTASQLNTLAGDLTNQVNATVTQANSYLQQIANVNTQIDAITQMGNQPNDLMDQRDGLVDKLSQLAGVQVDTTGGTYTLSIAGQTVIQDQTVVRQITATPSTPVATNELPLSAVGSGELGGLQQSLSTVAGYHQDLNNFANALATGTFSTTLPSTWSIVGPSSGGSPTFPVSGQFPDGTQFTPSDSVTDPKFANEGIQTQTLSNGTVIATIPAGVKVQVAGLNGLQQIGFSANGAGSSFFGPTSSGTPITADNITVTTTVNGIASAFNIDPTTMAGKPGDGTLAIAADNMKYGQLTFPDPGTPGQTMTGTLDQYVQSIVGQLGIQSQTANQQVANQTALTQQIDQQRQSVAGVSIDEEMSNVIKYQQAYSASARMVTTLNDMFTTLINLGK